MVFHEILERWLGSLEFLQVWHKILQVFQHGYANLIFLVQHVPEQAPLVAELLLQGQQHGHSVVPPFAAWLLLQEHFSLKNAQYWRPY